MNTARLITPRTAAGALHPARYVSRTAATRSLHLRASASLQQQSNKENLMDKDSMNPTSTEYSKTDGGDDAAAHDAQAFNPKNTDPDSQANEAGKKPHGEAQNPLNVSPGNSEANPTGKEQSQTSAGAAGGKPSERSSPDKRGS